MALSLSSSLFPKPFIFFRTIQRSNLRSKTYALRLLCCSGSSQNRQFSSDSEKKSFAVATGELFLGIASKLIRTAEKPSPAPPIDETNGNGERIATVIEDEIEPEVIWEQRVKDVEAEKERKIITSPGFSFSAAGLLFPYHLGVAQFLVERGYIKETTPLAGSSAGSIICAVIACGLSMQKALEATKTLADDCRRKGTAFRLGALLRDSLEELLPDDAHTSCNGRIRVAITLISWRPRGLLVDQFDSKRDLINAIVTSSFIPGYLSPRPATVFRNRLCIDGGLTFFMPPTSASKTVRVCAFPTSTFGVRGIGISPDCNPENRATPRQLFNWALEPAEDEVLDRLFELGYADAATWAEQNPAGEMVHDDNSSPENVSANLETRT
ncbi:PREDICTED: patatin-like phospholipase domain-containing protein 3 [Tarenaya hassleriana]|uniref:patatin-like phospholipase domain-containing protein 3 n=1 Tax=Tarenaya hassleriana TaxID=28532 RepID=UPI00053C22BB|nr:PREDICTED: patatin-like phospholipase domain-containing protein 3 [Tarenaya hassleriana]